MLGKLAYRNTKRNIKDYLIYLIMQILLERYAYSEISGTSILI